MIANQIRDIQQLLRNHSHLGEWDVSDVSVVLNWVGLSAEGRPVWQADVQYSKDDVLEYVCNINGHDAFGQGESPERAISNLHAHLHGILAPRVDTGEDKSEWLGLTRLY